MGLEDAFEIMSKMIAKTIGLTFGTTPEIRELAISAPKISKLLRARH